MIPAGHIAGVPLEELLPGLATSSASLLVAKAWLNLRLRHPRRRDEVK